MMDHQRGCAGRDYTCTCGYEDARDSRSGGQPVTNDKDSAVTQADRYAMESILWVNTIIDDQEAIAQAFARHRQYGYDQGYYDGCTRQPTQSDALREALESIKQRCETFANINLVGRNVFAKKAGTLLCVYEDACAALEARGLEIRIKNDDQ